MSGSILKRSWNTFFYQPTDPTMIGLFRICFGILILINGLILWPDLLVWFGQKGVLPYETSLLITSGPRINLFALLPTDDSWVIGLFFVHMFAALLLTLGLFTRISAATVFITLVSFHHRNALILNSGDTLIRIVSFLIIFSQAGATCSLDWAWKVIRGRQPATPAQSSPWAQRMIQLELCMVYVFTVFWKLQGATWRNGTAVYYASRLEEFHRFPVPWILDSLPLLKLFTWSTLAIELAMGTLVWIPQLRPFVLISALLLHLGLEYSMNIPLFQWIMTSTFLLFFDAEQLRHGCRQISQFLRKSNSAQTPVFFDGDCGFCQRISAILKYLDFFESLEFLDFRKKKSLASYADFNPARAEREMAVKTSKNQWLHGYFAIRYVLRQNPFFLAFSPDHVCSRIFISGAKSLCLGFQTSISYFRPNLFRRLLFNSDENFDQQRRQVRARIIVMDLLDMSLFSQVKGHVRIFGNQHFWRSRGRRFQKSETIQR